MIKLKYFFCFLIAVLYSSNAYSESYAFRLTNWAEISNSYRLEIFEFDIHSQDELEQVMVAFEKDSNLIKIGTTLQEVISNSKQKSILLGTKEYNYFPCAIIVNMKKPFLISTEKTKLKNRFTFNGIIVEDFENKFVADYSYEQFGTFSFSIKRKQNIVLNKMYFIASTWDLSRK